MKGNINHYRKKPSVTIIPAKPCAATESPTKAVLCMDMTQVEPGISRSKIRAQHIRHIRHKSHPRNPLTALKFRAKRPLE
jgi:hypothetical protein